MMLFVGLLLSLSAALAMPVLTPRTLRQQYPEATTAESPEGVQARAVSSVTKQLTGGAEITFAGSAKRAFASRMYYKSMMERIDGIRL